MEEFTAITTIIGIIQPPIIEIIKYLWVSRISNIEIQKSVITLVAIAISALMAYGIGYFGKYNLGFMEILSGAGMSFSVGQLTRRATKLGKDVTA